MTSKTHVLLIKSQEITKVGPTSLVISHKTWLNNSFLMFYFLKVKVRKQNLFLSFFHATTITLALTHKFSSSQVEVSYLRFIMLQYIMTQASWIHVLLLPNPPWPKVNPRVQSLKFLQITSCMWAFPLNQGRNWWLELCSLQRSKIKLWVVRIKVWFGS
jgi:hypothetical protein